MKILSTPRRNLLGSWISVNIVISQNSQLLSSHCINGLTNITPTTLQLLQWDLGCLYSYYKR
jgi:hypothetical protein